MAPGGAASARERQCPMVEQIREVFEANKSRYDSPRVSRELRQRGLKCGHNRIARLMREKKWIVPRRCFGLGRRSLAGAFRLI
jgi:transposase InsO family protein